MTPEGLPVGTTDDPSASDVGLPARLVADARALIESGRLDQASELLADGPERVALDPDVLHARALVLVAWKRYREARETYLRAEAAGPCGPEFFTDAGWCCYLLGDHAESKAYHSRAVAASPASVDARFALAVVLQAERAYAEALSQFRRVEELAPAYPDLQLNLGTCELGLNHLREAQAALQQAIDDDDRNARAWCQLGRVHASQNHSDEAIAAYRRAWEIEQETGAYTGTLAQYAACLLGLGRAAEACRVCEAGLPATPDPWAHATYAFALLTSGRFREGCAHYEFRWCKEPMQSLRTGYNRPVWSGQPLAGKTILLRSEQGYGDIVQFVRFTTPLKAMGAKVVLQVHQGMTRLADSFEDVDRVMSKEEACTAFDYYLHLMSLPHALGTELATIPSRVPYVGVEPDRVARWAKRLGPSPGLRVGIVWAGNPDHVRDKERSVAFDSLSELWRIEGVDYLSLQKEPRTGDADKLRALPAVSNVGPELQDFADTAAVISLLDLVVCVDTAIAHLAGALGKPVWLLLPKVADFRWMQERDDSPWYPTMRLFRQSNAGEWNDVVARVADSLRAAAGRPASLTKSPEPGNRASGGNRDTNDPALAAGLARVTEMRDGILQYLPEHDAEARSVATYGEYLRAQLDVLARVIPTDARVVEAGSGIGAHALWFAKVLAPEAHLFLYERRPVVRYILGQNLEANRITQRATLPRGMLVGPEDKSVPAGDRPSQPVSPANAPPTRAFLHTVDDLRLDRLDLLKVRAGEPAMAIVEGADATLWRLRPRLLLEAPDDEHLFELARFIGTYGYRSWRVAVPLFAPGNFNRREYDIFAGERSLSLLAVPEEVDVGTLLADCEELVAG